MTTEIEVNSVRFILHVLKSKDLVLDFTLSRKNTGVFALKMCIIISLLEFRILVWSCSGPSLVIVSFHSSQRYENIHPWWFVLYGQLSLKTLSLVSLKTESITVQRLLLEPLMSQLRNIILWKQLFSERHLHYLIKWFIFVSHVGSPAYLNYYILFLFQILLPGTNVNYTIFNKAQFFCVSWMPVNNKKNKQPKMT